MRYPLITLTTDFGLSDHFVGAMKGVISGIAPRARIIDITHEIPPFDILGGAFVIGQARRTFPAGTIHVVVVDPGVGSPRKPLLVQSAGQFFVGPDNGVFSFILQENKGQTRHVTGRKYFRHPVSNTFHGRDIFSPVAAHLACGVPPARFGKRLDSCVMLEGLEPSPVAENTWRGTVLKTDRFGNLITNFRQNAFPALEDGNFELRAGRRRITRMHSNFSEGRAGGIFLTGGSSGFLEIVMNQDSAARALGSSAKLPLILKLL